MFIDNRTLKRIHHPHLKVDGFNKSAYYAADIVNKDDDCFKNYGGYPRSELAIINEQQSLDIAKMQLDAVQILPDDTKLEKDVSDLELQFALKSRYLQTPSEIISYNERLLAERDRRAQVAAAKKAAAEEARRDAEELQALRDSLTEDERAEIIKRKRSSELDKLV